MLAPTAQAAAEARVLSVSVSPARLEPLSVSTPRKAARPDAAEPVGVRLLQGRRHGTGITAQVRMALSRR